MSKEHDHPDQNEQQDLSLFGAVAMLTNMELVPHEHLGMPCRIQKHTLVYTIVIACSDYPPRPAVHR